MYVLVVACVDGTCTNISLTSENSNEHGPFECWMSYRAYILRISSGRRDVTTAGQTNSP